MSNILFLGGFFESETEKEILLNSKSDIQYAANKFQNNLIEGFILNNIKNLDILSAPFIGTYPRDYKSMYFYGKTSSTKKNIPITYIPFNNLWGYRNISRANNLKNEIKKFSENDFKDKVIVVYSPHTPYMKAASYAKKLDPSIHICLIVPDLPHYMNLKKNKTILYKFFKKIDIKQFESLLVNIDSFVLLTEKMKDKLDIGKRDYIVIEGIVNPREGSISNNELSAFSDIKKVKLVYTGTLNQSFGILNLLYAFHGINNPNLELIICGKGDSENEVINFSEKDKRIKYLGQINNEEVLKIQNSATILINPRQNNEEYTKYSFPSKNMEYLLTGRPVIAYKLDGIPTEYDQFFFYVPNNSIESLKETIERVSSLSDSMLYEFGKNAKNFVLKNKNTAITGNKILTMISESRNKNV